jgi:RNA polymerase sigma-70 factor (ECF subfamily)
VNDVRLPRLSPATDSRAGEPEPELSDLLAASSRGDQQAFAQLYDLTSVRVYGLVLRVVRDRAQAAEVTQDVYLQVWRESARFDPRHGSVLPWLLMLAHRRAVDRVRSAQSASARDDRYASLHADRPYDQVAEQAHANLAAQRVRRVLEELTEVQRGRPAAHPARDREDPHQGRPDPATRRIGGVR